MRRLFLLKKNKNKILWVSLLSMTLFALMNPWKFADLWLTKDQQGQILFKLERYEQAASIHANTRWRAYSMYAAEKI